MCDQHDEGLVHAAVTDDDAKGPGLGVLDVADEHELIELARFLCTLPEQRSAHLGSIGYGATRPGDRVLIAVDRHYDDEVVAAISSALAELGATVDLYRVDPGPDRRFAETDELEVAIRRGPWTEHPRRWEGNPRIEQLAEVSGYDLLIHGRGGPTAPTSFRYEQIPWLTREHFTDAVVRYPPEVIATAAQVTWDAIWLHGRGGEVVLTDLEGTEIHYPLDETYWDGTHHGWVPEPKRWYGHLFAHPTPPLPHADAYGTVRGTTSHFSRAFPQITLNLRNGQVDNVDGGGAYGVEWAKLLDETRGIHYPGFPRPGLFHFWEAAIGGHPKVRRPLGIEWWSSGGFEWERRRSGVIHLGFGTFWRGPDEHWAADEGLPYGHLHVHLLFPTFELIAADGASMTLIRDGRLTALDDSRVRAVAERYGDPDELLAEDWVPAVPGISAPGDYADFARDPSAVIYDTAVGS